MHKTPRTDAEWARAMDIPLAVFLGRVEFPELRLDPSTPCGLDDFLMERYDALREAVALRKEWGEDSEGLSYGEYLAKYSTY